MITGKYFVDSKEKIGQEPVPEDLLEETFRYLNRKKRRGERDQPHLYNLIERYFAKLVNYGMTEDEKEMGAEGLELLRLHRGIYHGGDSS